MDLLCNVVLRRVQALCDLGHFETSVIDIALAAAVANQDGAELGENSDPNVMRFNESSYFLSGNSDALRGMDSHFKGSARSTDQRSVPPSARGSTGPRNRHSYGGPTRLFVDGTPMPMSMPRSRQEGEFFTPAAGGGSTVTPVPFNLAGVTPANTDQLETPANSGNAASTQPAPRKQGGSKSADNGGEVLGAATTPVVPNTAAATPATHRSEKRRRSQIPVFVGKTPLSPAVGHGTDPRPSNGGGGGDKSVVSPQNDDAAALDESSGVSTAHSDDTVLSVLEHAYASLCQYQCRDALAYFALLPDSQRLTGWVQHQIGRAHLELLHFSAAQQSFKLMRQVDPYRFEGLELYSSCLFQLEEKVELSHLSQQLLAIDRQRPETWCVVGNCFARSKDHEAAIKYFRRAIRTDPDFTYAYTLCGHELFTNEEYDEAIRCFRQAMVKDPRHFKSWYGLGTIYHRQQKQELAEFHFRKAIEINPRNTVLHVYVGIVRLARAVTAEAGKRDVYLHAALESLAKASELEPTNPLANLHRARVFSEMGDYRSAVAELEVALDFAPQEFLIYTQLANACKMLSQQNNISNAERRSLIDDAVRHFTSAVDIDRKQSQAIKAQIQELQLEYDSIGN